MPASGIRFFSENTAYKPGNIRMIRKWLAEVIQAESKQAGEISIIFCDDDYLHGMNVKFLSHDTLTDVITFDYCEGDSISGDVFISIERVRENSRVYSRQLSEEVCRVMVHGVLHLCGYKDKTKKDSSVMRMKEEYYLERYRLL